MVAALNLLLRRRRPIRFHFAGRPSYDRLGNWAEFSAQFRFGKSGQILSTFFEIRFGNCPDFSGQFFRGNFFASETAGKIHRSFFEAIFSPLVAFLAVSARSARWQNRRGVPTARKPHRAQCRPCLSTWAASASSNL